MSRADARAGARAAAQAWLAKGCPIAPPELTDVPPCSRCGDVPVGGYHRTGNVVECVDRHRCYRTMERKGIPTTA